MVHPPFVYRLARAKPKFFIYFCYMVPHCLKIAIQTLYETENMANTGPLVDEALRHYSNESFPQLGIGAYIAAGYCANILENLAEGKEVKYFPKFYLSPLLEEI